MKFVYLLRHAKSSWSNAHLPDFERPLNERGVKAAPVIGKYMSDNHVAPQLILCSPAKRAKQTAKLALEAARIDGSVIFDQRLYLATGKTLVKILSETSPDIQSVLLIGHNPGLEEMIELLVGHYQHMSTANIACISFDASSWKDVNNAPASLVWLVRPKDLSVE